MRTQTWYRPPVLKAARVDKTARRAAAQSGLSYADAKALAYKAAEHWADQALSRPASSQNHGSVRIAGKPYHWRQDYTGQLKLAAGEAPWGTDVH